MEIQNNHNLLDYIESSKKEAFLQSESWRKFQESFGRKTFHVEDICKSKSGIESFCVWVNIIAHKLPIVGEYFYIPRGPILIGDKSINLVRISDVKKTLDYLLWLAKDNHMGWIRFDARSEKDLVLITEALGKCASIKNDICVIRASHDMQPREIFVIDILKNNDEILNEMKSKTRYNIRLSEKKGVVIKTGKSYIEDFLRLNRETARRDGITTHEDEYYLKMLSSLPEDMIQIYAAEYEKKIIAANLVIFFGDTVTYAHGASSSENRDVMAPYLLQWRQIQDAIIKGFHFYDFGGVAVNKENTDSVIIKKWEGITRFKLGFSPKTEPIVFPGSYDIIINPRKYTLYKGLQRAKVLLYKIKK